MTTMTTPTPRTDAKGLTESYVRSHSKIGQPVEYVTATFARQLETELVEALKDIETMETRHAAVMLHTQTVVDENDQLREQLRECQNTSQLLLIQRDNAASGLYSQLATLKSIADELADYLKTAQITYVVGGSQFEDGCKKALTAYNQLPHRQSLTPTRPQ